MRKFNVRLLTAHAALLVLMTLGCGGHETVAMTETDPRQPPGDTVGMALSDLNSRTYLGFAGGLYEGGADTLPADHAPWASRGRATFDRVTRPARCHRMARS